MDKRQTSLFIALVLLAALVAGIGYLLLAPSLHNEKSYPAGQMFLRDASLVQDETTGSMVIYSGADNDSVVAFGPYVYLSPGNYCAFFRLKADPLQAGPVCTIDVTSWSRNQSYPLALRTLASPDFTGDGYDLFALNFTSSGESDLEFRTIKAARGEVWESSVTVSATDSLPDLLLRKNLVLIAILLACTGLVLCLAAAYYYYGSRLDRLLEKLPLPLVIFLAAAFCYTSVVLLSQAGVLPGAIISGDEPHYLLITQSLVQDHDYYLQNNLANETYLSFFPYNLSQSREQFVMDGNGNLLSIHGIGLSLLLIVPFLLGGAAGARLFIGLVAALAICLLYVLLERSGISRKTSFAAVMLAAVCSPLLFYSFSIYTEMVALAIVLATALLFLDLLRGAGSSPARYLIVGLLLAFLPWLGVKYAVLAVSSLVIAGYFYWKNKLDLRKLSCLAAPVVLSLGLFGLFLLYHFGSLDPGLIYNGLNDTYGMSTIKQQNPLSPTGLYQAPLSLLYRFFDQSQGLVFYAPAYLFFLVGLGVLIGRRRVRDLKPLALLTALTVPYLFMYMTTNSYGGYCPPSRTIIPLLPLILWLTAIGLEYLLDKKQVLLLVPAIAASLALATFLLLNPTIIYDHNLLDFTGTSLLNLSGLFPDQSPGAVVTILFWSLVVVLLLTLNALTLSLASKKHGK